MQAALLAANHADDGRMRKVLKTLHGILEKEHRCDVEYGLNCSRPVAKFPMRTFDDVEHLLDGLLLISFELDGCRKRSC
jgi:hypothetical protein